ncbi:hypothetical protein TNCV_2931261 [Trichonephila clavipes]|nr:hypothetical protein TNCV_2931261 [Trichonephila clavipes]
MTRKRFLFNLRTHDNIYGDGKVRGETRSLDFKVVDLAWMKKGIVAGGAAIEGRGKGGEKEEGSEEDGESQQYDGVRETWQNEWDTDYVGDDRNKMVLTTKN